jgi:hypothetical protein
VCPPPGTRGGTQPPAGEGVGGPNSDAWIKSLVFLNLLNFLLYFHFSLSATVAKTGKSTDLFLNILLVVQATGLKRALKSHLGILWGELSTENGHNGPLDFRPYLSRLGGGKA